MAKCETCKKHEDCRNGTENPDVNGTLQAKEQGQNLNSNNVVRSNKSVRRLTPLECERLQGYPDAWPGIGEPNIAFIRHFRELREQGHKLILWTCREGEMLQKAIDWCADYGLGFDAHNENLPELIEKYGNDCRKVGADFYCDDKNYWPMPEGTNK